MFHHESERPPVRSKTRRWRQNRATTVFLLAASLAISTCAWLSLVFSRRNTCWHAVEEWQSNPVEFPWEPPDIPDDDGRFSPPVTLRGDDHRRMRNRDLSLGNIVFGIAGSSQLWPKRKEYVKLWWRPDEMRGYVWLEEAVVSNQTELLPPVMVSEDISRFRYTNPTGHPSGIRIARIVQEAFRLDLPDVRWFVMGDDDTIFCAQNLLHILKKYDSNELYYVGNPSESHSSNTFFSHGMAFGGGGIAISYRLAETLSKMLDDCLERYPFLFGSDDRLHACITEIGVPLTKEPGFHQFDVHGNAFGILAAHPIAPFVSMHHLDEMDPVFPELGALDGLSLLQKAMEVEPSSFLQQSICYDRNRKLTFSISTGYVVQVYPYIIFPRDLGRPEITFRAWNKKDGGGEFDFDTRKAIKSPCSKPFIFFLNETHVEDGNVVNIYKRDRRMDDRKRRLFCMSNIFLSEKVQQIKVVSKPMTDHWFLVQRRHCCKAMGVKDRELGMTVDSCSVGKARNI